MRNVIKGNPEAFTGVRRKDQAFFNDIFRLIKATWFGASWSTLKHSAWAELRLIGGVVPLGKGRASYRGIPGESH